MHGRPCLSVYIISFQFLYPCIHHHYTSHSYSLNPSTFSFIRWFVPQPPLLSVLFFLSSPRHFIFPPFPVFHIGKHLHSFHSLYGLSLHFRSDSNSCYELTDQQLSASFNKWHTQLHTLVQTHILQALLYTHIYKHIHTQ